MSGERKPLDVFAIVLMIVLCICWGLQHVAIKIGAQGISTTMQIALRSTLAGMLVLCTLWLQGEKFSGSAKWFWPGILAGICFTSEFLCVSVGLTYTSASHMVLFLYAAPIFTSLGLHCLLPSERLSHIQFFGVGVSFVGIALAFAPAFEQTANQSTSMLFGDLMGMLGGLFWAATTIIIRKSSLSRAPARLTVLYQHAVCSILLLPIAWVKTPIEVSVVPAAAWGSLLFQTIVICFASYLAWFWMLRRYIANRLSVFSFLTPIFGVVFGVLLLNDNIKPIFMLGTLLVIAGIIIVNLKGLSQNLEKNSS